MTEVPEHLLARSRERRAAITGDDDEGGDTSAAEAGAAVEPVAATPPPAAPPPEAPPVPAEPEPVAPHVEAAQHRKKMPIWASAVMVTLPIWAVFYVGMLEPPATDELQLADNGATAYATCASCHGGDGSGTATGRQLNSGEVLLTFPAGPDLQGLSEHLSWVYLGTEGTRALGVDSYGDPARPGGQREVDSFGSGMSGFANLGVEDLVSVVFFERLTHGGLSAEDAEIEEQLLLAFVEDDPEFASGSPEEITELLTSAAESHGVELAGEVAAG